MFTEERQSIIIGKLKDKGRVEVPELAETLNVSVDTVRRDLKSLEEKGTLRRTHGGAISRKMSGPQPQMKERKQLNNKKKERIARRGAELVEPGDSLILDGSSSVLALIPYLSGIKDLSIFTSSPMIACAVIDENLDARLEIIGGVFRPGADNATGYETVEALKRVHADKVFMGVCGLNSRGHLTTFNPDESSLHQVMIQSGQEIILLMDSSKWDQTYIKDLGEIPDRCIIISDKGLPPELETTLEENHEHKIPVIRV
jgi:DeoR/GlpR family transcriptional regulator of sugar metabolism